MLRYTPFTALIGERVWYEYVANCFHMSNLTVISLNLQWSCFFAANVCVQGLVAKRSVPCNALLALCCLPSIR